MARTVCFAFSFPLGSAVAGVTTGVDVTVEAATSLSGGRSHRGALHGVLLAHGEWASRTWGDEGWRWRGYGSALAVHGRGPTARFADDFLTVSNLEAPAGARLYSTWLEASDPSLSLRAGLLLADDEFAITRTGANLLNASFGWPAFISANTVNTGPAYSWAAPGIRLEQSWTRNFRGRFGLYDGDTLDSPAGESTANRHGTHWHVGGRQGWFAIAEFATPVTTPFVAKMGAWLHTAQFSDVSRDAAGELFAVTGRAPRRHARNGGVYAALETTLAGRAGHAGHVSAFVRGGLSPSDRNPLACAFDAGIAGQGLFPGRPDDVSTVALVHAQFSARFATHARALAPGTFAPDFEHVVELSHRCVISPQLTVIPDLQFVRHPGGTGARDDLIAFMLRLSASL